MKRATIIFGNGLGMALDSGYFQLKTALKKVWEGTEHFTQEHKELLLATLPKTTEAEWPEEEDELHTIQVAVVAAQFLASLEAPAKGVHWLNPKASQFPGAFRRFIHEVSWYFHQSNRTLPHEFTIPLCKMIRATHSHIATLNYDNLLYDLFVQEKICDGYEGNLIDGFWSKGFKDEHLHRYAGKPRGFYLHLHGSPLYTGIYKRAGTDRAWFDPDEQSHIVLTHADHKPMIIESSEILTSYWKRLHEAFKESAAIVIFGYSGLDKHLNALVAQHGNRKPVHVIEWGGNKTLEGRKPYWTDKFGLDDVNLMLLPNILGFTAWESILAE